MKRKENYSLEGIKGFYDFKKILGGSSLNNLDFRVMHYGDITNLFKKEGFLLAEPVLDFLECNIPREFDYFVEHYTEKGNSTKNKFVFYRKHPEWKMEKYFATISFSDN